jgi:hypothetical protein
MGRLVQQNRGPGRAGPIEQRTWAGWPYTTESMGRLTLHKRELSRLACRTEKMDRLALQNR